MKAMYVWIIGGTVAAILITFCLLQWPWARSLAASPLQEKTVIQSVLHQYPGEVLESRRLDHYYLIKLEREKGKYDIKVNVYDGIIESITRTQAYTDTRQESQNHSPVSPPSKDISGPVSKPDPVSLVITEKEAAQLAAKAVNGTSDDIELHRNEKGLYYLVEVEIKDGREAVVQVNAVSGSIDSVTWEKEKQDHNDE
ncbi:PepSY domain-containing protein [Paenibacillus kribbensis]|uniref:PepSY domain-containing protein n=1 Tax=Paenibacillus TaxID=44249 RepID=UPI00024EF710|nr:MULTISPECIES: PepSY domain-containing protein [Paenibacillus]EHS58350.1 propeptide pepsy amd peptidase m4 [Paenibacillus sp. Aloe-11]MEC0233484.1 PepSY domain-containing protein [Paenibacillus kribbensis]